MLSSTAKVNLALSFCALMLGAVFFFALLPGADAATPPTLAIWNDTADPRIPFKGFDTNPVKLFDIDGDGRKEIIAQNDNQWFYVFDSEEGEILYEATTKFPLDWGARSFNGPEVAILSHGGTTRIIVANSAAYITSFRFDPEQNLLGHFSFVKEWERRADDCYGNPGMDAKPVLADLDRDGRMEILAATEEVGLVVLRDDGSLFWKQCLGGGNAEPTVADLNGDRFPEIVHVSDAGVATALNGRSGATLWRYSVHSDFDLRSGAIAVGAGIGQLDGVGGPDVVFGARDSHDLSDYENDHAVLIALSSNGTRLWQFQDHEAGNPLSYTRPIVVDADRDGRNEIYWGDWNTIGHKGGVPPRDDWKQTGPANFYRIDHEGKPVWRQSLDTYWSNKDLAVADVDADGVQEVLANGPGHGGDGIWYLDTESGRKEQFVGTHPWKVTRGPVLGDLWGTDTMQMVIAVGPASRSVDGGGILVYDTKAPYNAAYPHLPEPTLGNGPAASSSPARPTSRATTPPASSPTPTAASEGTFEATFSVPPGVHEWWVEVRVDSENWIDTVHAQVNGTRWVELSPTDRDTWGASFHVPSGSRVVFRATDVFDDTATSRAYTWP